MVNVHRDLGGRFDCSETLLRIGFVLHILTFASRPPVAMREPSGCTWTEKMDKRLGAWSLFPESLKTGINLKNFGGERNCEPLWMTHEGLVNFMASCWG